MHACARSRWRVSLARLGRIGLIAILLSPAACIQLPPGPAPSPPVAVVCSPDNTLRAEIVALEQAYVLNRFGAYVPAGMLYALRRDVVFYGHPTIADETVLSDQNLAQAPGHVKLRQDKRPRPLVLRVHAGGCLQVTLHNLMSPGWVEEGGEPPYPTVQVAGKTVPAAPAHLIDPPGAATSRSLKALGKSDREAPRTRHASLFITGLESRPIPASECPVNAVCGGDGTYVGLAEQQGTSFNAGTAMAIKAGYGTGSLVAPGQTSVIRWFAPHEGTFLAHSMGAPVGGEGDGGQIGLGLFAAVNVEPKGSRWYRSQLTAEDLADAAQRVDVTRDHPYRRLNYEQHREGKPLLALVEGQEIVHSDLNAIIVRTEAERTACTQRMAKVLVDGQRCEPAFREFTVVLHDEVHAQQAFPELEDPDHPLHYLKDGMGINYGVSSMGSLVASAQSQRAVGPAAKCPECRAEEFFLSSWASGDPALILQWDAKGERPIGARYPDDPSNVHHSYLGDPVVFRNLHAGPKETHVFHLHAHQWVLDASDPNSTYLDSQTISPGATFSYGIEFGGAGNRNFTVGDSIFHCHLYPHFAQGMWELWRVHDVFENGMNKGIYNPARPPGPDNDPQSRNLPDAEVRQGIATPAIVPIPGLAMAPMPSASFRGYPFYIPGEPGHRPPQPVLDMDVNDPAYTDFTREPPDAGKIVNGGLPRHVVRSDKDSTLHALNKLPRNDPTYRDVLETALHKGGAAAQVIAKKVHADYPAAFEAMAADWDQLHVKPLKHSGEPAEQVAMSFHEGRLQLPGLTPAQGGVSPVNVDTQPRPGWWTHTRGYPTDAAPVVSGMRPRDAGDPPPIFHVNGGGRHPGSPFANPCPEAAPTRDYKAAFIQTEMTVNKHGWFDPQGRIVILEDDIKDVIDANTRTKLPEPLFFRANSGDCINFKSSNFVPSALNADDFQIYTPTDTIGQHIHLVKFDVTSSDGSGNGWNYEDASFAPEEVRERILAINATEPGMNLKMKAHPLFQPGSSLDQARSGHPDFEALWAKGQCPARHAGESDHDFLTRLAKDHPYCGAQRTTQRWWADPILARTPDGTAKDNTLRTVFTHDHFGPSSHQQHGLYAALVIEPANSVWQANPYDVAGGPQGLEQACRSRPPGAPNSVHTFRELAASDPRFTTGAGAIQLAPAAGQDPGTDALYVAFALRSSAELRADERAALDTCVQQAVLGGADLSTPPVALSTAQGKDKIGKVQLSPIMPRAPLKIRNDGGPTSTRASIIAPTCAGDPNSSPLSTGGIQPCPGREAQQTRREFALAFADFAGVYSVGLEPINPETPRDVSMRRFGERQVAIRMARPIAISSEDPGTQLINYRQEPLALRIADVTWNATLGNFDYSQSHRRAQGQACGPDHVDCLGDMANGFSSYVHSQRDRQLATQSYREWINGNAKARGQAGLPSTAPLTALTSPALRSLFTTPAQTAALKRTLEEVESWRQGFNCALYDPAQWTADGTADALFTQVCKRHAVAAREPWRVFGDPATPILASFEDDPVQIRLIQGAQEAQHIFTMNGVKWHRIPDSANSGWTSAQPLGISEHFEFDVHVPRFDTRHVDYLYFGSSVDQLWDGMWGVLRAYQSDPKLAQGKPATLATGQRADGRPGRWLPQLPVSSPKNSHAGTLDEKVAGCQQGRDPGQPLQLRSLDISAVQACELTGGCEHPVGLSYSDRHHISDPHAVVYVMNEERSCTLADAANVPEQGCFDPSIAQPAGKTVLGPDPATLDHLKQQFRAGRSFEPLIARAAAGACITVHLRNHLPKQLPFMERTAPPESRDAYFNFLPMITDGFNLNQVRMSHAVGISAPKLMQSPLSSEGSNVGLNSAFVSPGSIPPHGLHPGSLVPPGSARDLAWSATHLTSAHNAPDASASLKAACNGREDQLCALPTEFGALPLRSFGDPIQHPMHGLVGALVIGPPNSQVQDPSGASNAAFVPGYSGGPSRQLRRSDGRLFADHVLVMQDAVSAVQDGFPVSDLSGAEEPDDYGIKAINYKTEPLWARRGGGPGVDFGERNTAFDYSTVFSSAKAPDGSCVSGVPPNGSGKLACDPETPVFSARAGQEQHLHFVHPGGHTRQQGLVISGHGFRPYAWGEESAQLDPMRCQVGPLAALPAGCQLWQGVFNGFGPMMGQTLSVQAGGSGLMSKDYLVRSESSFLLDGGLWGILRVRPDAPSPSTSTGSP